MGRTPLLAARHTEQQLNGLFADDGKEIDPVGGVVEGGKRDRVDGNVLVGVPGAPEAHAEDEQQEDPQVGAIVLYHGLGCAFLLRYRPAAGLVQRGQRMRSGGGPICQRFSI